MLQARSDFNTRPIEDLIGYLDSYSQICDEEFDNARAEVEPHFLDELHTVPPRRQWPEDYPLEWTSERQRKAYFATDGFGAGIPYQRTGNLPNAWELSKQGSGVNITYIVKNTDPASPFVYGSLAKSNPGRFQQGFHAITGWERMADTVQFWLEALWEQYVANMHARLGELMGSVTTRQRAYTRTRS